MLTVYTGLSGVAAHCSGTSPFAWYGFVGAMCLYQVEYLETVIMWLLTSKMMTVNRFV